MSRKKRLTKYNHYLKNDDLTKNLREKTLVGGVASVGSNAIRFVIQMGGTVVLARILFPEDFGLIAMVVAITGFFNVFKDAGLSMATIQKKEITHEQISTLFWIISAISFLLMFCIFATSPVVAWFYGDERLVMITLAFGVSIFLGGLGIQHRALLRRRMSFGMVASVDISVQFIATVIGICLALLGLGYWALVGMHALRPLIATLLLWLFCPWRPGLPRRGTGVRKMIAFGGYLSFSRIMPYLINNMDNILIGSVIGPYALGLYSRAYALIMLPIGQIVFPISNVALTALSRLQTEPDRFRKYFKKALLLSTTFTMPVVIFSYIVAEEIILLILGDKWGSLVPLFQTLVPAAFVSTFSGVVSWPLVPFGKTKLLMKITVINGITCIVAFLIGIKWGAIGVATALSIHAIITRPFLLWYSFHNSIVSYSDFWVAIFRPASSCIVAGMGVKWFKVILIDSNVFISLLYSFSLYLLLYVIVFVAIPGGKKEIQSIIQYFNVIKNKATTTAVS